MKTFRDVIIRVESQVVIGEGSRKHDTRLNLEIRDHGNISTYLYND
jgi:hypothetical protein